MGTPCKCCGKIVCQSRLIRFDHDRYNYEDIAGFAKVTQKIEHKVDGGASRVVFDSIDGSDRPVFCSPDSEPIACNLEIIDVENTTINSVPVQIKTTTKIERKFALAVPINDVYDWGRENFKGHEFIYSKYIRAGDTFDDTNQAPSCENVPGGGDNFPLAPEMRGEVRILKAGGGGLPISIQEWENQKNAASRPKSFTGDDQKEIRIDDLDEVDGNGTYIVLVECPEENSKAEWGTWFRGSEDEENDTVFIELRRITDIEVCDGSSSSPAFKNHDINGPDDLDDWHEHFMRVANGDYRSLRTFMDVEVNFGSFFGADYLEKYFLFCGKLHFGFFQGEQPYLDALYEIAYDRDDTHLLEVEFPDECPPDSVVGDNSAVVAEIIDPITNETKKIRKLKSFLGAAPTDIMPTSCPDDGCGSKYVDGIYQYTPEEDHRIHRFKYKITGGPDRFNNADYVIDEMRTNFKKKTSSGSICPKSVKPLSTSQNNDTCTATYFTKECATQISGAETKDTGVPKKAIRRGPDIFNGWFIRPCVIESSAAAIPAQDLSTRRIYNKDIYHKYLYVPHYGEYNPATINFKIQNHEFYPYILKINDINEECPKECVPTAHAPEWRNVDSTFCPSAQTPAKINYKEYGTQGGAVDRHITRSFDHFECGTVLQSCRQLQDCMGSYSEATAFSMITNVFKATHGWVYSQGSDGVCHYPRCDSYHRNGEGPSCGTARWELFDSDPDGDIVVFDWRLVDDSNCNGCEARKPDLPPTDDQARGFLDGITRHDFPCVDPENSHLDDTDAFPNLVACNGAIGVGGGGGARANIMSGSSLSFSSSASCLIDTNNDGTINESDCLGGGGTTSTCLDGGSVYHSEGKNSLLIGSHNVCEQGNCGKCGLFCNGIIVGKDGNHEFVINEPDPNDNPNSTTEEPHKFHYNGPKGQSGYFCYNLDLMYQTHTVPGPLGCCITTYNDGERAGEVEKEPLQTETYCTRKGEADENATTEFDEGNKCCEKDKGCCTVTYKSGNNPAVERISGITDDECTAKREESDVETTHWEKRDDGQCPSTLIGGYCCTCKEGENRTDCGSRPATTPQNCFCNEIAGGVITGSSADLQTSEDIEISL